MMEHFSVGSLLFPIALLSFCVFGAAQLSPSSCPPKAPTAPNQTTLSSVTTALTSVFPSAPFGIVYASKQQDTAFVSLQQNASSTLGVLNTSTFPPRLAYQIPLPSAFTSGVNAEAAGLTITNDGQYLFVSAGEGAIVIDPALAAAGSPNAVVGTLNGTTGNQKPLYGAIQTSVTRNNTYAFVSQEYGESNGPGNVDVFALHTSRNGSVSGTPVGYLNLGFEVVGTVLSPDGRTLYATSESINGSGKVPGFVSVIDVETLVGNPSNPQSILSNVNASCGPVRIIVSSDGEVVWVTARESDHLLAFNSTKLVSSPDEALIVSVQVGTGPVGLTFARNETRILTADSNRFYSTGATSGLSVVDIHAALAGSNSSVLGRIPTGLFPRELALSPDGSTVLVADYDSNQIQAVDVSTLP